MQFYVYCILIFSLSNVLSLTWQMTLGIQPQIRQLNWQSWIRVTKSKDKAGEKRPCESSTHQVSRPSSCSKLGQVMLQQTAWGSIAWILISKDKGYTTSWGSVLHCLAALFLSIFFFCLPEAAPSPCWKSPDLRPSAPDATIVAVLCWMFLRLSNFCLVLGGPKVDAHPDAV